MEMKSTTVNLLALLLVGCVSTAPAYAKGSDVIEGKKYIAMCSLNGTPTFSVSGVSRVEVVKSSIAPYMVITNDAGIIYHYFASGETCGVFEDRPQQPQSGGDIG